MRQGTSIDDRIRRLVPEVEEGIRTELQQALRTLRAAGYPAAVVVMMPRLILRLFRHIYAAVGRPMPSDNLFDVLSRATGGDPERKIQGYRILPDALAAELNAIRVLSNKTRTGTEETSIGEDEAELALKAFLSLLQWYYCEWDLGPRLPSLDESPPSPRGGPEPDQVEPLASLVPLAPADCPLVSDPALLELFNGVVRRVRLIADTPESFRQEAIRQIVTDCGTVRARLARGPLQVGFFGAFSVGKSSTINSIIDASGEQWAIPTGVGDPAFGSVVRIRPLASGENTLTLRYLTPTEYQGRRSRLLEEIGIDPTLGDLEVLRELAGDGSPAQRPTASARLLLESYSAHGSRLVGEPAREEVVPFAKRAGPLGSPPTRYPAHLLLRDLVIAYRTDFLSPQVELIDVPSDAVADEVLPDLDGAVVLATVVSPPDQSLADIWNMLRSRLQSDASGRIWSVLTRFDGLRETDLHGGEGQGTIFDAIERFLERLEIPAERLCLVSNRIYRAWREQTLRGVPDLAVTDAIGGMLGLAGQDLVPAQLQERPALLSAYQALRKDGGIGRLRRLLSDIMPREVERDLAQWARARLERIEASLRAAEAKGAQPLAEASQDSASPQRGNPYTVGRPVASPVYFDMTRGGPGGHGAKAQAILRNLQRTGYHSNCIAILGERRVGKTSLLRYVWSVARGLPGLRAAWMNLQSLNPPNPGTFYETLSRTLQREGLLASEREFQDSQDLQDYLHELPAGDHLVLFLDEFQIIAYVDAFSREFFDNLRAIADTLPITYVVASTVPLHRVMPDDLHSSPFSNIFMIYRLGSLTDQEADALIRFPPEAARGVEEFAGEIRALAGGHPWLLQMACSTAWDLREASGGKPDPVALHDTFMERARDLYQYLWDHSSPDEKRNLLTLASGIDPGREDLNALVERGLVTADRPPRIRGEGLAEFIRSRTAASGLPGDQPTGTMEQIQEEFNHRRRELYAEVKRLWLAAGGKVQRTHSRQAWTEFIEEATPTLRLLYPAEEGGQRQEWDPGPMQSEINTLMDRHTRIADRRGAKYQDRRTMDRAARRIVDLATAVNEALVRLRQAREAHDDAGAELIPAAASAAPVLLQPISTNDASPQLRLAVVVGVSEYAGSFPSLPSAERDADAVASFLAELGYTVVRLMGPRATSAGVIEAFAWCAGMTAGDPHPDSLFVFYFSGHGYTNPADDEVGYLLLHDSDPGNPESAGLEMSHLVHRLLPQVRLPQTLVMLDACHAGFAAGVKSLSPHSLNHLSNVAQQLFNSLRGRMILACAGESGAREAADLGHDVFTYYILRHWRDLDGAPPDGTITFGSLVDYVTLQIAQHHPQAPRPISSWAGKGGSFVLRRIPDPGKPQAPAEPGRDSDPQADARSVSVPGPRRVRPYPCRLGLKASHTGELSIGQPLDLTLEVLPDGSAGGVVLAIPANALELTCYVEGPAFLVTGEHARTLSVRDGKPIEKQLTFRLIPLSSGKEQQVRFLVYVGGQGPGTEPVELSHRASVVVPDALPNIRELIDRRAIPPPQPDVILHVSLEDVPAGQQVVYHVTCPALGRDREPMTPLPLTRHDLAGLRRTAVEAALAASTAAPCDARASLRAFGALLYDRLLPLGHGLRKFYRAAAGAGGTRPWTWLIVSDAEALLPWELVCPHGTSPDTGEVWYDDFMAGRFLLGHWIAREGLTLAAESPLGRIDLVHYAQRPTEVDRWLAALGGPDLTDVESWEGPFLLTTSGSPHYSLHVLRYTDRLQTGLITAADAPAPLDHPDAGAKLHCQRLDFTLKRPLVGLSFVTDRPPTHHPGLWESDTSLEEGWAIPFLRAGANGVVGSRWPVLPQAERLFLRAFHEAVRSGDPLGSAVGQARRRVRLAFPDRPDWLAYAHFGHPECGPYFVQPARGFTLFEAIDHRDDEPFIVGRTYCFRASYRATAPVWYHGRLRLAPPTLEGGPVTVSVVPMLPGMPAQSRTLDELPGGAAYQGLISLEMPSGTTELPLIVRFRRAGADLETLELCLDLVEGP
jgi:hypothetical protein